MENRKKMEKKHGRERGRKPLTASGATLTPTRRLSNLYLPSNQNDQTQTNGPIPPADSQSYAAGTSTFFVPGFIRRWNISTVDANWGKSRPRKHAGPQHDEFRTTVKSTDDELCAKHGDSASRKILGFLFNACRPCLTINSVVITGFLKTPTA